MAQAMVPAAAPAPVPVFVSDPVANLRAIQENVFTIAEHLGPTEAQDSRLRIYHMWHAMAGQLAQQNNWNVPDAPDHLNPFPGLDNNVTRNDDDYSDFEG